MASVPAHRYSTKIVTAEDDCAIPKAEHRIDKHFPTHWQAQHTLENHRETQNERIAYDSDDAADESRLSVS